MENSVNVLTRKLAMYAMLIAIIAIMSFTPLGYLKIAFVDITFLTIPVAIGAIVMGAKAGAIFGGGFGLTSFIQAVMGLSPFGTFLMGINPVYTFILCMLPRILMGLLCGVIFSALKKRCSAKSSIPFFVSSFCSAALNTLLFTVVFILLFGMMSNGIKNVMPYIIAFLSLNSLIEAGVCFVVGSTISKAVYRFVNK